MPLECNSKDTVLFGHMVYFEFIHERDLDNPKPRVYQMHELEQGQRYTMLVTTCSGLYRYNMNDLVEVSGFHNQFAKINFIQKVNGIISLTGEKLAERQFIDAVRIVEKQTDRQLKFFVSFGDVANSRYHFYYEFADGGMTKADAERFTGQVDHEMQLLNPEYRDKRTSQRIKGPETELLVPESFETFKAKCIDMGYRDGQFKLNLLMQDEKRHAMFKELIKESA
ncbi:MAG: hypothetical protein Ta2A_24700 [Treponemataceae bacterium]|nr:MAG: hypothetical protein Ta2A_24700 [Treponemataceae bacterium]